MTSHHVEVTKNTEQKDEKTSNTCQQKHFESNESEKFKDNSNRGSTRLESKT